MYRKAINTGVSLACIVLITGIARADGTPECNNGVSQGTTECGTGSATLLGFNQTAVGAGAVSALPDGTAIGASAVTASNQIFNVPYSPLNFDSATAIGSYSFAVGGGNLAVGAQAGVGLLSYNAITNLATFDPIDGGTAIGDSTRVTATNGTALGFGASVSGGSGIAAGAGASATALLATAIGSSADAVAEGATAIGANTDATGAFSTTLGTNADANSAHALALGALTDATGIGAIAIGGDANGDFLGAQANAGGAVALGADSRATLAGAIAIGANAQATAANSVAIGSGASTAAFTNSVALGAGTAATANNQVNVGGRTVGNVANGVALSDAVNLGQLNTATAGLNAALIGLQGDVDILYDQNRKQDRNINKANEGVAMALAMESPNVPAGSRFAVSGGIGGYQGRNALATAISAAVGEKATVSAGLGYGLNSGEIGYRAGFQVAF